MCISSIDFPTKNAYNLHMDYVVEYSKRQTVSIKITNDTVKVCAPKYYESEQGKYKIDEFVQSKSEWIRRKLCEQNANISGLLPGILDFSRFYLYGHPICHEYTDKARLTLERHKVIIPKSMTGDKDKLKKHLKRVLSARAETELQVKTENAANVMNVRYDGFGITNAGGKWGSCSAEKYIQLNWRLILLPRRLADYVIVHELCHAVCLNHSREFWELVKSYMPDYTEQKELLKKYAFLMEYLR